MKTTCQRSLLGGLLAGALLLGACQTSPAPETRYYLLQSGAAPSTAQGAEVRIVRLRLPAYLKQSNLMLSISEYEIRPAMYHQWSEPLEDGVRRVLEAELASRLGSGEPDGRARELVVEIDIFHASQAGSLLLKGRWSVSGFPEQAFAIEARLDADGYPAAVAAHARALGLLAGEMAQALSTRASRS